MYSAKPAFKICFRIVYLLCPFLFSLHCIAAIPADEIRKKYPTIRVAVAANFSPILNKLIPEFTKKNHIHVEIISGATGALYQQIRHGAPFDVFLSADAKRPLALSKEKRIEHNSLKTYAIGKLAFWSSIHKLNQNDVLHHAVKQYSSIAIANPNTAPYGQAAKETLQHIQLWETYNSTNKLITGINVNQTFHQVRSKSVQSGFVALSQLKLNNLTGIEVPQSFYQPIEQKLVVLKRSQYKESALKFTEFLLEQNTQKSIASFGYTAIMPVSPNSIVQ